MNVTMCTDINTLLPIKSSVSYIIGSPNTGKTTHAKLLISHAVYSELILIVRDESEWSEYKRAQIIKVENPFENLDIIKKAKDDALILLDDYHHSKKSMDNFYKCINFELSHRHISLLINIHSIYKNYLFTSILTNAHLFLTYCNINTVVVRNLDKIYGLNYKPIFSEYLNNQTNDICFINLAQNYIIPQCQTLFKQSHEPTIMFKTSKKFYIFQADQVDITEDETHEGDFIQNVSDIYKQKPKIINLAKKLYTFVEQEKIVSKSHDIIIDNSTVCNLLDLIVWAQNPNAKKSLPLKVKKILQYMQIKKFTVPVVLIKNKQFHKYIT